MESEERQEAELCCSPRVKNVETKQEQDNDISGTTEEHSKRQIKKMEIPPGMSKNQMKKMIRNQRWIEMKATKRAHEKQKKKEKRKALKESGAQLPPNRKVLKLNSMKNSSCHVKIAIDCSFDELMSEKDINKLVKQLNHCYATNRRRVDPLQFYITSWKDKTRTRMEEIGDYKGWDVFLKSEDYMEVFGKQNLVYLTSDSPNVLTTLDDDKAYIIGGLVDHNHQKGLCYKLAQERGIAHAQLPIGDYLAMKSRKVLTINHVFEILLEFTHNQSWEAAFFKVIPGRKVQHFKNTNKETSADKSLEGTDEEESAFPNDMESKVSGNEKDSCHEHVTSEQEQNSQNDADAQGTTSSAHQGQMAAQTEHSDQRAHQTLT